MNAGTRSENYVLIALSLIAAIWFFIGYPSQDPRSTAKISFQKQEIELRAAETFSELGFSTGNYTIADVAFLGNQQLLDSLQHRLGRDGAIELLQNDNHPNIKPFFWEINFRKKGMQGNSETTQSPFGPDPAELSLLFDESGQFIGLGNASEHLPQQKVHRSALTAVFDTSPDSTQREMMPAVSDSLMGRLLYFDMQKEDGAYANYQRKPEAEIRTNFNRGIPYRHSPNDARAMAEYYLTKTGWDISSFRLDTIYVKRVGTINAANVHYIPGEKEAGQALSIDVVVAPTGALLQMNTGFNSPQNQAGPPEFGWEIIHLILVLLLIFAGLIVFFFRMRARAIDTQSALVAAVIMGLIVPLYLFLSRIHEINPFSANASMNDAIILFLNMGILGALSSVGFFVLFAISDSITRQHWPRKLSSYNYLRQGMMFNKPVGIVLLRGVGLSFILAGFWTLLLHLSPQLYFSFSSLFVSEQAVWPPLYLLLTNSWFSFAIICSLFLVIGSQAYGMSKNKWITGIFTVIACSLIVPLYTSFGPPMYELLQGALLGIILSLIYIKWDFLTVLIAHFLFLGLVGSASGWAVSHSPDTFTFIFYMGFLVVLCITGGLAIYIGREESMLPEYVPSYVEELAQEQRIKQELQIAREVQQSFLPSKIPAFSGLDVAAVCQPAYETGGDYYDFIPLDDHRVAVAIGDVSGKGIEAAFYMTFVKGILHSLCRETDSPAEVLRKTNRLFYDNATKGTFVSLIYGIIDLRENTFRFARAGHNPILHVKISSDEVTELQPNGLGIGLTKEKIFDNKIQEIKLSITEDDLFLFYTDGIVEALNQSHEFYGTKKLVKLVKKQKHNSAAQIIAVISKGVTRFIGSARQHDDMTLMAIKFGMNEQ